VFAVPPLFMNDKSLIHSLRTVTLLSSSPTLVQKRMLMGDFCTSPSQRTFQPRVLSLDEDSCILLPIFACNRISSVIVPTALTSVNTDRKNEKGCLFCHVITIPRPTIHTGKRSVPIGYTNGERPLYKSCYRSSAFNCYACCFFLHSSMYSFSLS